MQGEQLTSDVIQQSSQPRNYGGIKRLPFLIGIILVAVLIKLIGMVGQSSPLIIAFLIFGVIVLSFVLVINRLQNIGWSVWWSFLLMMPPAIFVIVLACLSCPEGYRDTRKLDYAGKIIIWIPVAVIIGVFIFSIDSVFLPLLY